MSFLKSDTEAPLGSAVIIPRLARRDRLVRSGIIVFERAVPDLTSRSLLRKAAAAPLAKCPPDFPAGGTRRAPLLRFTPVALPGQTFDFSLEQMPSRAGFVGAASACLHKPHRTRQACPTSRGGNGADRAFLVQIPIGEKPTRTTPTSRHPRGEHRRPACVGTRPAVPNRIDSPKQPHA